MTDPHNLQRFVDAQDRMLETALAELLAGRKQTHWMWFVFPQIVGLGSSPTAIFYAIRSADEARAYLADPILGTRLRAATEVILQWAGRRSADAIFGPVDAMKLRSSLTLFDAIAPGGCFGRALSAFFDGPDQRTLALLAEAR